MQEKTLKQMIVIIDVITFEIKLFDLNLYKSKLTLLKDLVAVNIVVVSYNKESDHTCDISKEIVQ